MWRSTTRIKRWPGLLLLPRIRLFPATETASLIFLSIEIQTY